MKIFTSVSSKRLLKFTLILLLILIFSTTYIVIETNSVISEQEFEKLVKIGKFLPNQNFIIW